MGGSWALSARLLIYYPFFLRKIKASLIPEHESQSETMRKCPVCRTRCETHKGNEGKTAFCTFFSLISAGTWKHKREIFPSRMCTAGGGWGGGRPSGAGPPACWDSDVPRVWGPCRAAAAQPGWVGGLLTPTAFLSKKKKDLQKSQQEPFGVRLALQIPLTPPVNGLPRGSALPSHRSAPTQLPDLRVFFRTRGRGEDVLLSSWPRRSALSQEPARLFPLGEAEAPSV